MTTRGTSQDNVLRSCCLPLPTDVFLRGMINRENDCFLLSAIQMIRALPICHAALLNFPDATQPTPPTGEQGARQARATCVEVSLFIQ